MSTRTGYIAYAAKTKTWWNPTAFGDGSYSIESAPGSGKSVLYTGSYSDAGSGKTARIRDTYALITMKKYSDLGEVQSNGTWKTINKSTCTKS